MNTTKYIPTVRNSNKINCPTVYGGSVRIRISLRKPGK